MGAAAENIIVMRFDIIQYGPVERGRGGDGEAAAGIQQLNARPGFVINLAGAGNLELHERSPAVIYNTSLDVSFAETEFLQLLQWKIQTSPSELKNWTDAPSRWEEFHNWKL